MVDEINAWPFGVELLVFSLGARGFGFFHQAAFGQVVVPAFSPCRIRHSMRGLTMKKKIDISAVPELATSVGVQGSAKQKEVVGPLCLAVAVAIVYAL